MSGAGPHRVDPWRFAGSYLAKMLGGRIPDAPRHPPIPWTPVEKPLSASKVALLSTAGTAAGPWDWSRA